MLTPDRHGKGLTDATLDPLRYGGQVEDPAEATGILRSYMPKGVRVLDVGCGLGSVTEIVNRGKGNDLYGIEPDAARAAEARKRGVQVTCGFLTDMYFVENGSFDVIMFTDVLEHWRIPPPCSIWH